MNKFVIAGISFVSGLIVGGFGGVVLLKNKIMADCEADIEAAISEAKSYYKNRYGDFFEENDKNEPKLEDDSSAIPVPDPIEYVDYTQFSKNSQDSILTTNMSSDLLANSSSNEASVDEKIKNNSIEGPYLIGESTYYEHEENYENRELGDGQWHFASLVYYKDDDKLANDKDDSIIKNWKKIVGTEWKDYFGDDNYGNSKGCVYVRNEKIHTDFMIQEESVAYKYAILDYDEDVDDENDLRTMYKDAEKEYREGDEE